MIPVSILTSQPSLQKSSSQVVVQKMKFLFLFISLIVKHEAIVIECDFKDSYFGYKCEAKTLLITARDGDRFVKRIYGQNLERKSYENTKVFYSGYMTVNYFPHNLENVLAGLETIQIDHANLKEITSSDLRPFGAKLRNLWLGSNDIEVIQSDLFDFNPNIEWIFLENNKIKNVESGAFGKLRKLQNLNFINNPCHSGEASDQSLVAFLIANIEFKCEQTSYMLKKYQKEILKELSDMRAEILHLKRKLEQTCSPWEQKLQER